jgi:hypothetical protein
MLSSNLSGLSEKRKQVEITPMHIIELKDVALFECVNLRVDYTKHNILQYASFTTSSNNISNINMNKTDRFKNSFQFFTKSLNS